mmetsp:Transcript_45560/g.114642  ORF Transcript_45560/g.114642 Transcript_45560/m.114642 type:complete len:102 (-) Transcript_45560:144-449(-)
MCKITLAVAMLAFCAAIAFAKEGAPCDPNILHCDAGEVCVSDDFLCLPEAGGRCTQRPSACTADYNPVCGCNGVTYGNKCEATAAGQSVRFPWECGTVAQQ